MQRRADLDHRSSRDGSRRAAAMGFETGRIGGGSGWTPLLTPFSRIFSPLIPSHVQVMKGSRHDCRRSAAERKGSWAHAIVAEDSVSVILPKPSMPSPPSKDIHKKSEKAEVQVCAVRRPGGGRDLSRVADVAALPLVPDQKSKGKNDGAAGGALARPNVYMFGDRCVLLLLLLLFVPPACRGCSRHIFYLTSSLRLMNWSRVSLQEVRFNDWIDGLPDTAPLVIIEVTNHFRQARFVLTMRIVLSCINQIGAGKTIPTIRNLSETIMRKRENTVLVRLNWDDCDVPQDINTRRYQITAFLHCDAYLAHCFPEFLALQRVHRPNGRSSGLSPRQ